jgi:hypothetical protein
MSLSVSKVYASSGCGRFRSGNPKWRRSTRNVRPPTLQERYDAQRNANLNPNKNFQRACERSMRTVACACGPPSEAVRRQRVQRQMRTNAPALSLGYVSLRKACQFADVLYYAFLHARVPGSPVVQSQLARGVRYTIEPHKRRSVLLEAPQANFRYQTSANVLQVLAALPGAFRSETRAAQRHLRASIAVWWLGEELANEKLTELNSQPACVDAACAVPLDPATESAGVCALAATGAFLAP